MNYSAILFFLIVFNCYAQANLLFPPDTLSPDTNKNVTIIYDTVKTEKIVYVYDTLIVYDTIIEYDTTFINSESKFFTEFHSSFFSINRKIQLDNDINQVVQLKNNTERIKPGYSFGFNIGYQLNKFYMRTGLSYSSYNELADYDFVNQIITPVVLLDTIDNSYWQVNIIDTFYQIIGTDTTMVVVADSTLITNIDSTITVDYDTSSSGNKYSGKNSYKYIEVPFILGKEIWKHKKLMVSTNIGFIAGFLIKAKGKTILPPDYDNITDIEQIPFAKALFYAYVGIRMDYSINRNISVYLVPGYRYMINSLYDRKKILMYKTDLLNIKVGIKYNL